MSDSGISVDAQDASKNNSEIVEAAADETTVSMELQDAKCYWNDAEFSRGDRVNADGKSYVCSYGRWVILED